MRASVKTPPAGGSHVSSKGQVVIPKPWRDAKGIAAGSPVEFVDHPEGLLMRLPLAGKKYTVEDLMNTLPRYEGPTITDEMMRERMEQGMRERWARKARNSRS